MKLNELPKIATKGKKRIGRGIGSGKGGHTVGRGSKGQKARGKVALIFEGTKIKKSLIKRLPLWRGKGKFKPHRKPLVLNVKYLNLLPANAEVTLETLDKYGIITKADSLSTGVKILGEGNISVPLIVRLPVSKGARQKIEKAGGKVEIDKETDKDKRVKKTVKKKEK